MQGEALLEDGAFRDFFALTWSFHLEEDWPFVGEYKLFSEGTYF